jgi:hypothetical protein
MDARESGLERAVLLVFFRGSSVGVGRSVHFRGSSAFVGPKPECFPIQAGPGCDALELGFGNSD